MKTLRRLFALEIQSTYSIALQNRDNSLDRGSVEEDAYAKTSIL